MKLVFLGTPAFAVPSLECLLEAGHQVQAVYTQPDRPSGRGQTLTASPVKRCAAARGLPVRQPERIRRPEIVEELRALAPEAMVVVGYGQIIPQAIIDIPPLGIVNVHASLLPKYRGAAPVQWAIACGETVTGVTTMRIDAGLDTGDILLARETPIGPEETAVELAERLARLGADLLVETLAGLRDGTVRPRKQDNAQASHAPLLRKEDGLIDWNLTARQIFNRVRGFQPWPGAFTNFRGSRLRLWRCRVAETEARGAPGSLAASGRRLFAACGENTCLELLEVQVEGGKRMSAEAFLNGCHLSENERCSG